MWGDGDGEEAIATRDALVVVGADPTQTPMQRAALNYKEGRAPRRHTDEDAPPTGTQDIRPHRTPAYRLQTTVGSLGAPVRAYII